MYIRANANIYYLYCVCSLFPLLIWFPSVTQLKFASCGGDNKSRKPTETMATKNGTKTNKFINTFHAYLFNADAGCWPLGRLAAWFVRLGKQIAGLSRRCRARFSAGGLSRLNRWLTTLACWPTK